MRGKRTRTVEPPERAFDRALLEREEYRFAVWIVTGLFSFLEGFGGLMTFSLILGMTAVFTSILVVLELTPLLYEYRGASRMRRAAICRYFPVDRKEFVKSKLYFAGKAGAGFWLASFALRLLAAPLFGFANLLSGQLLIAGFFALWTALYLIVGICGCF